MQGLLHWLLASPLRSGLAAAALALSRLFDVFGAGLLALVALRKGFAPALKMIFVALPLVFVAGYVSGLGAALPLAVLGLWLPVLLLSQVLRQTGSLALMLQAGIGIAGTALLAWYVLDAEPLASVQAFIAEQLLPLMQRMEGAPTQLTESQLTAMARFAPGLLAAGSLVVSSLAVMIGRWWQAIAFNPGGFRHDFHRLRHGRIAVLAIAALTLAAAMTRQPVVIGFALAGVAVLIFQGVALVHGVVAAARQPGFWLWGMYGMLLLLPLPATALLAIAGSIDNWMDFRRLAGQDVANSNE